MAKERRDLKNRILNKGEYQRADGRYMYKYIDADGCSRFVYSWTLTKTDRTPSGKPAGPCLRDLEIQISKEVSDGINTFKANHATVDSYFDMLMTQKKGIKQTTRALYNNTYNLYVANKIGKAKMSGLKYSDILRFYNSVLDNHGVSISALESVDCILKQVLKMAVRDGLLRNNPADGALAEITRERGLRSVKRKALTKSEQKSFMEFVENDRVYSKWKSLFTVMLGTGCRIGEICALTWDDCDFTSNVIHIRRTMCYNKNGNDEKMSLFIQTPKSDAGIRSIPMFSDVREALHQEKLRQMKNGFCEQSIDGITGFVFINSKNGPLLPQCVNSTIKHLVNRYNKTEAAKAAVEKRTPEFLPNMSPHILRHTFCTRMCESGMDVKVVQEVMGHTKVSMTLDVYTSVTEDFKIDTFKLFESKIKIV